ncbi:MAG: hypothetical protein KBS42_02370, partial [Bacteroidales bacterium]|nr:hypothetical protein [Candidatus Colicola coprequi]
TIKNGATLTIEGSSAGRETYGDIIVENGGKLVIEETSDSVCVQNVYLATSFGEHSSSQVLAADRLTVHGNAFFDITWADNANAQKWHAFTVPFPVDARKGIYDLDGNQLTNEVNYAIMSYHGDVRAQGKYGWAKFRNIMTPGTFYLMTVDGTIPTFRFRKTTEGNLAATNLLQVAQFPHSGDAQVTDAGWNGIGNSQLSYVSVDAPVQVLDPVSYTYELMVARSTNFTVGTPFFYQATTDGTIVLSEPNASAYYAPRRMSEPEIKNVDVTLANDRYTDHLYLSATDEATAEYQIGHDLVKMTMTATPSVPQIFALAYNASLCMVDAPLTNDEAQVSIRLYAPANGEYTLSVSNDAAADVYLLHNGMPVWNLSESAYTLDLEKGNTEGYSLRLRCAHKQTTDIDVVNGSDESGVQKVIMDNQLYILRAGSIYDAQGRLIDFQR